jgi:hypothetical protein
VRSRATQLFHKLGVQATESVILISPEREKKVEESVAAVLKWYSDLQHELKVEGLDVRLEPVIEIMGLSSKQTQAYKNLAISFVERKAGDSGRYCERVFNSLEEPHDAQALERIIKNLEKHRRSWADLQGLCSELSLSNDWSIPEILAGIDTVIGVAREKAAAQGA